VYPAAPASYLLPGTKKWTVQKKEGATGCRLAVIAKPPTFAAIMNTVQKQYKMKHKQIPQGS
jgi:hypothetical protein